MPGLWNFGHDGLRKMIMRVHLQPETISDLPSKSRSNMPVSVHIGVNLGQAGNRRLAREIQFSAKGTKADDLKPLAPSSRHRLLKARGIPRAFSFKGLACGTIPEYSVDHGRLARLHWLTRRPLQGDFQACRRALPRSNAASETSPAPLTRWKRGSFPSRWAISMSS